MQLLGHIEQLKFCVSCLYHTMGGKFTRRGSSIVHTHGGIQLLKPGTHRTMAERVVIQTGRKSKKTVQVIRAVQTIHAMRTRTSRRQSNEFVLLLYPDTFLMPQLQETASYFVAEAE